MDENRTTEQPTSNEDKIGVKKVQDKLKKEAHRAYLNKVLATESEKFIKSPDIYVAPDFV